MCTCLCGLPLSSGGAYYPGGGGPYPASGTPGPCIPNVLWVNTPTYTGPVTSLCQPRPGVNVCGAPVDTIDGVQYFQHTALSGVPLVRRRPSECVAMAP
jgi:hypothetical protein